ncbi:MAG: hypothetical protein WD651_06555 [Acidimicrobiia bacterium]
MAPDRLIRSLASVQLGLVARRQLIAGGVSEAATRRRIGSGMLEEVTPRVLRLCGVPTSDAQKLMAALLHTGATALLSHTTSAGWWGIAGFRLDPIHVAIERNHHWEEDSPAVVHHATIIPEGERKVLNGIPVSSPALTIFQLAGAISSDRVARALDSAWSLRLLDGLTMARLLGELARPGRNGIKVMRDLLAERGEDWIPPSSNVEHRFDEIMQRAGITTFRRQVKVGEATLYFPCYSQRHEQPRVSGRHLRQNQQGSSRARPWSDPPGSALPRAGRGQRLAGGQGLLRQ